MNQLYDQTGRLLQWNAVPQNIVSLVPSITELLYYLQLDEQVVGITKFCVHPGKWFKSKTRIGGTKQIDTGKISSLNPNLVIANKEENVKEQVEEIAKDFPVYISDVNNLDAALQMIVDIGKLTGKDAIACKLVDDIRNGFLFLPIPSKSLNVCYLIWQKPFMTIGGDTFINDMLLRAGYNNIYAHKQRYPVIEPEELLESGCDLIFLSSEPFPFRQKHKSALEKYLRDVEKFYAPAMLPEVYLVDGESFSWYGSRLLHAINYFESLAKMVFNSSNKGRGAIDFTI